MFAILAACAPDPIPETAPPEAALASPGERLDDDPSWQPGDSEFVPLEVERWGPPHETNTSVEPIIMMVQIRNRCAEPAFFAVGPAGESPPSDAPANELGVGEGAEVSISNADRIVLRDSTGSFSIPAADSSPQIVFLGEGACERVWIDTLEQ